MFKVQYKIDTSGLNKALNILGSYGGKEFKEVNAMFFRSAVRGLRKEQMMTRPRTLSLIDQRAAKGNMVVRPKARQQAQKARVKYLNKLGKLTRLNKKNKYGSFGKAQLMAHKANAINTQRLAWAIELKRRRASAGFAGRWGWRAIGKDFDSLRSIDRSARLQKVSAANLTSLQVTNIRPKIGEFVNRIGYDRRVIGNIETRMTARAEKVLKRLATITERAT
jgi:hypothetical protein